MKMKEAIAIIKDSDKKRRQFEREEKKRKNPQGFRIHFERIKGCILSSDYFPDKKEKLIQSETGAWELAKQFAEATETERNIVNIYVVDKNFIPVSDYYAKTIRRYKS